MNVYFEWILDKKKKKHPVGNYIFCLIGFPSYLVSRVQDPSKYLESLVSEVQI